MNAGLRLKLREIIETGRLVGVALAAYRRYVVKPDRLNTDWRFNFTLPLTWEGAKPARPPLDSEME